MRASWLRPFLGEEATASLVKRANEQALFSAEAPKPAPKPAVTLVRCSEDKVAETCAACVSHHGICAGDCTVGGYSSRRKRIWAYGLKRTPEWSSEIYKLEMKLRWNALDEDGKKVFGREGVCEPEARARRLRRRRSRGVVRGLRRAPRRLRRRVPLGSMLLAEPHRNRR